MSRVDLTGDQMSFSVNQAVETYINAGCLSLRIYPFDDKFGAIIARGHGRDETVIRGIPPLYDRQRVMREVRHHLEMSSKIGIDKCGDEHSSMSESFIDEIMKYLADAGAVTTNVFEIVRA